MDYLFLIILFLIAFLYSFAGHGGASGYLALMAIWSIPQAEMRSSALILNIIVSLIAFINFYRIEEINRKLILALVLASIPASFFGAFISLNGSIYKLILGFILIIFIFRLLINLKKDYTVKTPASYLTSILGGIIGFISGLIGIGGGVILSPVLILKKWATVKQTATISAIFIFVNSISGIIGLFFNGLSINIQLISWILIVLMGGFLGSFIGSKKTAPVYLKIALAGVVFFASIKLIINSL